jgi:cysteinyl-tRNA synthetase
MPPTSDESRGALRVGDSLLPLIGRARVYVCGITPYDTTHLGHAATFVWADVAARVLRLSGVGVEVCRNITDVDDVLFRAADERDGSWRSLATQQTYRFEADMRSLGVARPAFEPHARDYIDEVIALAQALLAAGAAYEREGTVWFRGQAVTAASELELEHARELAGSSRPGLPAGESRDDAIVWGRADDGGPVWPSPWGPGRPGWHAECAAMALAVLGAGLDLHIGGDDLRFPHHAYEAAMAEAATGVRPFSRAWLHIGGVHHKGARMAKSTGNLVLVDDLLDRWAPEVIRLAILDRRYDDQWDFAEELLTSARDRLQRLWHAAGRGAGGELAIRELRGALFADLDVPRALEIAEASGGSVAREAISLLGLV